MKDMARRSSKDILWAFFIIFTPKLRYKNENAEHHFNLDHLGIKF
jgi:hypothetical protein